MEGKIGVVSSSRFTFYKMKKDRIAPSTITNWRKRPFADQVFAEVHGLGIVDLQDGNRGASNGSPPDQVGAIPDEMPFPSVFSRVKQPHHAVGLRVQTGDVRPFVAVAEEARKGEIIDLSRPSVLAGDDVVDRMRQRREGLGELAVFAA